SRRRHTKFKCDWSSDVCSSDLLYAGVHCWLLDVAPSELTPEDKARGLTLSDPRVRNRIVRAGLEAAQKARPAAFFTPATANRIRSEERRVGKECMYVWWAAYEK